MLTPLRNTLAPLGAATTVAVAASPLLTGLVSYWNLNEASGTRSDSAGTNHLTSNNSVGIAGGVVGNAADFDGVTSQSLSHASNADLQGGNFDFTIAGWVRFDDFSAASGFPMALSKMGGGVEYELFAYSAGGFFYWRVNSVGSGQVDCTFPLPSLGVWSFFEVWHDSVNHEIGARLNNGTASTATALGGMVIDTGDFRIGARGNGTLNMDGGTDEFGLWHRLLTSGERASLYNSGAGNTYPF